MMRTLARWTPGPAGVLLAALLGAGSVGAADAAGWTGLTPAQQQALAPLQRDWASIDANRQQKWLEVAARFPTMPADERQRVQQRMAQWARMTPAERASARMQFQEVRQLPTAERQARWQAYQALPDEERKTLARRGAPVTAAVAEPRLPQQRAAAVAAAASAGGKRNLVVAPAAPALSKPVAPTVVQARPGATTTTMSTRVAPPSHTHAGLPKLAATPGFVDPATLLPQRGPQGAAMRSTASASQPAVQP